MDIFRKLTDFVKKFKWACMGVGAAIIIGVTFLVLGLCGVFGSGGNVIANLASSVGNFVSSIAQGSSSNFSSSDSSSVPDVASSESSSVIGGYSPSESSTSEVKVASVNLDTSLFQVTDTKVKLNWQAVNSFSQVYSDGSAYYINVADAASLLGMKYTQGSDSGTVTANGFTAKIMAGTNKVIVNGKTLLATNVAGFIGGKLMADTDTISKACGIRAGYGNLTDYIYLSNTTTDGKLAQYNGKTVLSVNGAPTAPIIYSGTQGSQDTWLKTTAKNINQFAQNGIEIVQNDQWLKDIWRRDGTLDMATVLNQLDGILEINPNAKIMVRINVSAPDWWIQQYPDEKVLYTDGPINGNDDTERSLRASLASDLWRTQALQKLQEYLEYLQNTPEGDRIVGFHIGGGVYGEWHYYGFLHEPDVGVPMTKAFRSYVQEKYTTIANLNSAWGTTYKNFSAVTVPDLAARYKFTDGNFRDPATSRKVIDYYECQAKVVSSDVVDFAKLVKTTWKRPVLTGVFYGYLFGQKDTNDLTTGSIASQMDVQTILTCPYIDYISGTFAARSTSEGGFFRSLAASCALNGKLWISENDVATQFGDQQTTEKVTEQQAIALIKRNYMYTITENAGQWYYDFGPEGKGGEFDTPNLMNTIKSLMGLSNTYLQKQAVAQADTLVVYDMDSFNYVAPMPADTLSQKLTENLTNYLLRTGGAFDRIFLMDLKKVNLNQYKTVIFANTYKLDQATKDYIKSNVMKSGRSVLFMSASGYTDGNSNNADFISGLTGMTIQKVTPNGSVPTISLTGGGLSGTVTASGVKTYFQVNDSAATTVGQYSFGGVGAAYKVVNGCKVWYFGIPINNVSVLRGILKDAGSHIYVTGSDRDTISVGNNLIGIYSTIGGNRTITLANNQTVSVTLPANTTLYIDGETGQTLVP